MEVHEKDEDGVWVLQATGRLDSYSSRDFEQSVNQAIETRDGGLVLDMEGLDYVSSAGLRVLLMAAKQMRGKARPLALCGMRSNVREVFDISGFSSLFEIYGELDAAVNAVR